MITVSCINVSDIIEGTDPNLIKIKHSGDFGLRVSGHEFGRIERRGILSRLFQHKHRDEALVCAAVSALTQTLFKSITLECGLFPEYKQEAGLFEFLISFREINTIQLNVIKILYQSFLIGIAEIQGIHPEKIEIINVEA